MFGDSRTAIISGGMGDIGRAIAKRCAESDIRTCLLYHKTARRDVDIFIKKLSGSGHTAYQCDITDESEVRKTVRLAALDMGRIDVCIHSAVSPLVRKRVSEISAQEFREQLEVTLFGGLYLFQAVIPHMKEKAKGNIIGLTSVAIEPESPLAPMAGYLAAKSALRTLLRELSKELSASGIRVNAVAPAFVPTALHRDLPEQVFRFLSERATQDSPQDVANAVMSLCAPDCTQTGLSFHIDGMGVPL